MTRPTCLAVWLALNVCLLASCSDNSTPTQPETVGAPTVAAPSFSAASNTWSARAPLPIPLPYPIATSLGVVPDASGNSIVYAIGGTDGESGFSGYPIQAYDLATDTWTPKNTQVFTSGLNGVGLIGGKLYYSGGFVFHESTYLPTLYAYNPATDAAVQKANMPAATDDGVAGVIAGKLFVLPGACGLPSDCNEGPTRALYRYNPVNNSWNTRRSAPHYHQYGGGGVIGGKFYVVGGENASLDAYDPSTNRWKTLASMPKAGWAQAAVLGSKLYVVESALPYGTSSPHLFVYNPATNKWATKVAPPHVGTLAKVTQSGHNFLFLASSEGSELYTP
jgi:Kelch motif